LVDGEDYLVLQEKQLRDLRNTGMVDGVPEVRAVPHRTVLREPLAWPVIEGQSLKKYEKRSTKNGRPRRPRGRAIISSSTVRRDAAKRVGIARA